MTINKYRPEGRFAEGGSGINSSGIGRDNVSNSSNSGKSSNDGRGSRGAQ